MKEIEKEGLGDEDLAAQEASTIVCSNVGFHTESIKASISLSHSQKMSGNFRQVSVKC